MSVPQAAEGHPTTPPASDPASQPAQPEPEGPLTSLDDDGQSHRPRDARLIHLVLSAQGIHSYQERVPLQLLDFAYRYTSSVLSDSLRLASEGYATSNERGARRGEVDGAITVTALRQAIASRTGQQFQSALPRDFMLEQANEKNRVTLPQVERGYGVKLPPEKYCLTGVGWGLKDEWESEEDEVVEEKQDQDEAQADEPMGGMEEEEQEEDEEGAGTMEDVFGTGSGEGEDPMEE